MTNEPFLLRDLVEASETARYQRIDRTGRDEYRAHIQQSVGGVSYAVGSVLGELAFRCPAANDYTCTGGDGVT